MVKIRFCKSRAELLIIVSGGCFPAIVQCEGILLNDSTDNESLIIYLEIIPIREEFYYPPAKSHARNMITYTTSKTDKDLSDIINLQRENLPAQLTEEEMQNQGFVTVSHTLKILKEMHAFAPNIIIKDENKIVGYLLAMTKLSGSAIPILIPMFELLGKIFFRDKIISEYHFLVVGQVCIQQGYRGLGLLDEAYKAYKNYFKSKFDFAITEIAT